MARSWRPAFPALCLVLLPMLPAQQAGGWWGDLYQVREVPLERILEKPLAHRGRRVRFIVQLHELGQVENPLFTSFESEWYLSVSVWPDGAPLWDETVYRADFPYLFVRRGEDPARELQQAPIYSRFEVTGRVRDVVKDSPWIAVTKVKRLETHITEAALIAMVKGFTLLRLKRHRAAATAFAEADDPVLPPAVRAEVMLREAQSRDAVGETPLAVSRLEQAAHLDPGSARVSRALAAMRRKLGLEPGEEVPEQDG